MAIINLLPQLPGKTRSKTPAGKLPKFSLPKNKLLLFVPVAVIFAIAGIKLLALSHLVMTKEATRVSLQKKVDSLQGVYKEIKDLSDKKTQAQGEVSFFESAYKNNIAWSEKLESINRLIPQQIWLTSISLERQGNGRNLVIRGISTSFIEAEMISSITQYADRLEKESSFGKNFEDVKVGQLQTEKRGTLNIMNFVLYCKLR